ncbi:hypothetical protein [Streptomyces phaeochromogenes]
MARIVVLGAALGGLQTALLLAQDGHEVTVLERDPRPPPSDTELAWSQWPRPGIAQLRQTHLPLARWLQLAEAHLPDLVREMTEARAVRMNVLAPEPAFRGPLLAGDERFDTLAARRSLLESAATRVAQGAGIRIGWGTACRGLRSSPGPRIPSGGASGDRVPLVTGVETHAGGTAADLVVDCTGTGPNCPPGCGPLACRFPSTSPVGAASPTTAGTSGPPTARCRRTGFPWWWSTDRSVSCASRPTTARTRSVSSAAATTSSCGGPCGTSAPGPPPCACSPARTAGSTGGPSPTASRSWPASRTANGPCTTPNAPLVTGLVAVGDAWAITTPTVGRGLAMSLRHSLLLRETLRRTGTAHPVELVTRFAEATRDSLGRVYERTAAYTRHRLAEMDAHTAGTVYRNPDWIRAKALALLARRDTDALRAERAAAHLLPGARDALRAPALADAVTRLVPEVEQHVPPGPSRADLLKAIHS